MSPAHAVAVAARRTGLDEHLDGATADVVRGLEAIRLAGLAAESGAALEVEYPIAAPQAGGTLLSGYVDFVRLTAGQMDILDFKTDVPPVGPAEETYPAYAIQVQEYRARVARRRTRVRTNASMRTAVHRGWAHSVDGGLRRVTELCEQVKMNGRGPRAILGLTVTMPTGQIRTTSLSLPLMKTLPSRSSTSWMTATWKSSNGWSNVHRHFGRTSGRRPFRKFRVLGVPEFQPNCSAAHRADEEVATIRRQLGRALHLVVHHGQDARAQARELKPGSAHGVLPPAMA